jgi:maleamate amidohydrolase
MDDYSKRGYGGATVGFGQRIGIAVVDFQLGFTHPRFPLGGAALTKRAIQNTVTLLHAARRYADIVDLKTCLSQFAALLRHNA